MSAIGDTTGPGESLGSQGQGHDEIDDPVHVLAETEKRRDRLDLLNAKNREKKLREIDFLYNKKYKEIKTDSKLKLENHISNRRKKELKALDLENKKWEHLQNRIHEKKGQWEKKLNFLNSKHKNDVEVAKEEKNAAIERQRTDLFETQKDLCHI